MKASSAARKILAKFPKDVRDYFLEIDELCKYHGVTFYLGAGKQVNSCGGRSGGYFDDCERILAVAIGSSMGSALQTCIHEAQHAFGQWTNPKSLWHDFKIYNGHNRFFSYLSGKRIYKLSSAISAAIAIELDAERLAVKQIKRRWTKYINLTEYQKQSSAYLFSYLYMGETGKWPVTSPCVKNISKHSPPKLLRVYKTIPPKMRIAFDKYLR